MHTGCLSHILYIHWICIRHSYVCIHHSGVPLLPGQARWTNAALDARNAQGRLSRRTLSSVWNSGRRPEPVCWNLVLIIRLDYFPRHKPTGSPLSELHQAQHCRICYSVSDLDLCSLAGKIFQGMCGMDGMDAQLRLNIFQRGCLVRVENNVCTQLLVSCIRFCSNLVLLPF